MRKDIEGNSLKRIANMVVCPEEEFTELFIATKDGEYGYFRIGGSETDNFRFKEITNIEYIERTQHAINTPMFKTHIGHKRK